MKRFVISVTSLLIIISSFFNVSIVAEDKIDWDATVESLKEVHEQDQSRVNEIIADIENDKKDLNEAESLLKTAKDNQTIITETYNNLISETSNLSESIKNKELEIKDIENTYGSELAGQREQLIALKETEQNKWNEFIEVGAALGEKENSVNEYKALIDNKETMLSEYNKELSDRKSDLELFSLLGEEELVEAANNEIKKIESMISLLNDSDKLNKAYEEAKNEFDKANETCLKVQEDYKKAEEDVKTLEATINEKEANLESANKELKTKKEELSVLINNYETKKIELDETTASYNDINATVDQNLILVDSLKQVIESKNELLKYANEELNLSKAAYEKALVDRDNAKLEEENKKKQTKEVEPKQEETVNPKEKTSGSNIKQVEVKTEKVVEFEPTTTINITTDFIDFNNEDLKEIVDNSTSTSTKLVFDEPEHKDEIEKINEVISNNETYKPIFTVDISLNLIVNDDEDKSYAISNTKESVPIKLIVPNEYINTDESVTRTYKIIRTHDNGESIEQDIIEGYFNSSDNSFTFSTDRFSTYALVYEDKTNIRSVKHFTCEEEHNSINWVWSDKTGTCVYMVTNTSSR